MKALFELLSAKPEQASSAALCVSPCVAASSTPCHGLCSGAWGGEGAAWACSAPS